MLPLAVPAWVRWSVFSEDWAVRSDLWQFWCSAANFRKLASGTACRRPWWQVWQLVAAAAAVAAAVEVVAAAVAAVEGVIRLRGNLEDGFRKVRRSCKRCWSWTSRNLATEKCFASETKTEKKIIFLKIVFKLNVKYKSWLLLRLTILLL